MVNIILNELKIRAFALFQWVENIVQPFFIDGLLSHGGIC